MGDATVIYGVFNPNDMSTREHCGNLAMGFARFLGFGDAIKQKSACELRFFASRGSGTM